MRWRGASWYVKAPDLDVPWRIHITASTLRRRRHHHHQRRYSITERQLLQERPSLNRDSHRTKATHMAWDFNLETSLVLASIGYWETTIDVTYNRDVQELNYIRNALSILKLHEPWMKSYNHSQIISQRSQLWRRSREYTSFINTFWYSSFITH